MRDDEQIELTEEDISFLESLLSQKGWNIFIKLLEAEFDGKYTGLRNTRKTEIGYARICGFLDGIERASKVIQETINAYRSMKLDKTVSENKYNRRTRTPLFKVG